LTLKYSPEGRKKKSSKLGKLGPDTLERHKRTTKITNIVQNEVKLGN
jgi:hypothetical protein